MNPYRPNLPGVLARINHNLYFRLLAFFVILPLILVENSSCIWKNPQNNSGTLGDRIDVYSHKEVQYLLNSEKSIQTLDPQMARPDEEIVVNALFDGLTENDSTGTKIEPSLATGWDKNEDATLWTFNLRRDAKWSDGKSITANDFVFSWRRELATETGAPNPQILYDIKNASKFNQGLAKAEELGVKALDDYTLQVTMDVPTPFFDKLVTKSAFRPVPQQAVDKYGKDWTNTGNIISSGAFKLYGWNTIDGTIVVQRNETFWDNANTRLQKIIFYLLDASDNGGKAVMNLYESRKINATRNLPSSDLLRDKKDLTVGMANDIEFLSINTTIKPFDDVRVRKALSLAIDRQKLKEAGFSQYPSTSFTPPLDGYESAATQNFDPKEARRLLSEAGFPNGKSFPEVEYIYNFSDKNSLIAKFIQSHLEKELGIKLKLNGMNQEEFLKKREAYDFKGLAALNWAGDYADPNSFLENFGTDDITTGWQDEKYDEVMNSADVESDTAKRYTLLHEAENILADQQPVIPLFIDSDRILCQPYIKNLVPNPLGQVNWREVYIDESLYKQ